MDTALVFVLALYLLPWGVAELYQHPRAYAILAFNAVAGWTGVGWIVALLWALRARPAPETPPPAALQLVDPSFVVPKPSLRSRLRRPALGALALLPLAVLVGWRAQLPAERIQLSMNAELVFDDTTVRRGPSERWPSAGSVEAPCRVHVSEGEGGWLRIWRLSPCGDAMDGRAGWVRAQALAPTG